MKKLKIEKEELVELPVEVKVEKPVISKIVVDFNQEGLNKMGDKVNELVDRLNQ